MSREGGRWARCSPLPSFSPTIKLALFLPPQPTARRVPGTKRDSGPGFACCELIQTLLPQAPAAFGGRRANAEQIPCLFCSLSAGSFVQSSLGHGSAEMPRVTLSSLFVWAASQAASSRNNGIFSFVRAGKIKCDLNSLLALHQMSPPEHELSGSRGGAALPSTARTFPRQKCSGSEAQRLPCSFGPLAARKMPPQAASFLLLTPLEVRARDVDAPLCVLRDAAHAHVLPSLLGSLCALPSSHQTQPCDLLWVAPAA